MPENPAVANRRLKKYILDDVDSLNTLIDLAAYNLFFLDYKFYRKQLKNNLSKSRRTFSDYIECFNKSYEDSLEFKKLNTKNKLIKLIFNK